MEEYLKEILSADPDEAIGLKLESETEVLMIAAQAKLLSRAAKEAYINPSAAIKIIADEVPTYLLHPALLYLRAAVLEQAFRGLHTVNKSPWTEFDVHRYFWANLDRYLPGALKVDKKGKTQHQPDGWVRVGEDVIPVEIKKEAFTASSLRQLRRYMQAYGASKGIAVAQRFTVENVPDITFVAYQAEDLHH